MMIKVSTEPIDMKELATFIYGILNAITSGVISAYCLFGHVYFSREVKHATEKLKAGISSDVHKDAYYTVNVSILLLVSLLALVIAVVWFSSSIILIIGINKKKAAYVKFFFIYIVSLCIMGVIASIILMSFPWVLDNHYLFGTYVLIGTFLYSLPLLCVHDTFKFYESGMAPQVFDKKKLVEA